MNALIIGYGRAGKRHAQLLEKMGFTWVAVDPLVGGANIFSTIEWALSYEQVDPHLGRYDFAIICSPPDLHPKHIAACAEADLPILVEKPICGWGQLDWLRDGILPYNKIMPAFNYRWHPAIKDKQYPGPWQFVSYQYRPELPEWGIVLDHLPHTVDMLLQFSGGGPVEIDKVNLVEQNATGVMVSGRADGVPFEIIDWVYHNNPKYQKKGYIELKQERVEVDTSPPVAEKMFLDMYRDFLAVVKGEADSFPVTVKDAIRVQRVLERINDAA